MSSKINLRLTKKMLFIALAVVILFCVVSFIVSKLTYDKQFPAHPTPDWNIYAGINYEMTDSEYDRERVEFISQENKLSGYIFGQENDKGLVVISHGLGGGAENYLAQAIYFVENGYKVFSYDCTGSYESEGESTIGFPQAVIDLNNALEYIKTNNDLNKLDLYLIGHSWGGYAALNVLNYGTHDIKGVVSVSGVNSAIDFINGQASDMMGLFGKTQYPFLTLYQKTKFGDIASFTAVDALNKSNIPALIIHGEDDTVVREEFSVISKKDKVKNPNVRYIIKEEAGSGGHNQIFKSMDSLNYIEKINKEYEKVYNEYDQDIPYEIKKGIYASMDDYLVSELDNDLMSEILEFFENAN